jgi:hypothetical protein
VRGVLTVAKVTAGGGAACAAYLEGRSQAPEQGDYYLKDGERVEAPGRWAPVREVPLHSGSTGPSQPAARPSTR